MLPYSIEGLVFTSPLNEGTLVHYKCQQGPTSLSQDLVELVQLPADVTRSSGFRAITVIYVSDAHCVTFMVICKDTPPPYQYEKIFLCYNNHECKPLAEKLSDKDIAAARRIVRWFQQAYSLPRVTLVEMADVGGTLLCKYHVTAMGFIAEEDGLVAVPMEYVGVMDDQMGNFKGQVRLPSELSHYRFDKQFKLKKTAQGDNRYLVHTARSEQDGKMDFQVIFKFDEVCNEWIQEHVENQEGEVMGDILRNEMKNA